MSKFNFYLTISVIFIGKKESNVYHEIVVSTSESVFKIKSSVKIDLHVKTGFTGNVPDALRSVRVLRSVVLADRRRNVSPQTVKDAAAPG